MAFDPDKKCPLIQKKCWKHSCQFFVQIHGRNPNTGHPIDEWGCAVTWLPFLLIEGAQQTRQAGAAIESFRNEMVKGNNQFLTTAAQQFDQLTRLSVNDHPNQGE